MKTLKKQVKTLQKQVKRLRKDVNFATSEVATNDAGDACQTALIADLFVATWSGVNQFSPPVFTVPPQLGDRDACSYITVSRATGAVFTALASFVSWAATSQARMR